jgi:hypothetical protein
MERSQTKLPCMQRAHDQTRAKKRSELREKFLGLPPLSQVQRGAECLGRITLPLPADAGDPENGCPDDSRRLHHISFQTDLVGAMPCIARFMSRVQALQCSKKVKLRSARTFLKNGDRIKLTVALRGREIQHADLALALLNRFGVDLGDLATWNDEPKLDGKTAVMVLSPSR